MYSANKPTYEQDALRLESVVTCVGFDDILNETLKRNHVHFDTLIVVSNHEDKKTHHVARKYGAMLVQTDLFGKNGRTFNKGAAINAGFNRFQYWGWRMHLDADIILPDNFRRLLFNHTHLDTGCIYGADRMDIIGKSGLDKLCGHQHDSGTFVRPDQGNLSPRFVDHLNGYVPIGFFQLWNARCQKPYPYSLGTAAHDDVMFAIQWPETMRRLLPSIVCYHLCTEKPRLGANWDGRRTCRLGES